MDGILAALEASAVAQHLRGARWEYAAANTAHVLGIALLVGAIVPLDLRLLGVWRSVPRQDLARVLVPVAASGLALAAAAGVLLFATRAGEYGDLGLFQVKMALVAAGALAALALHVRTGWWLEGADDRRLAGHAAISLICWLGGLVCGRLVAFAGP